MVRAAAARTGFRYLIICDGSMSEAEGNSKSEVAIDPVIFENGFNSKSGPSAPQVHI